MTTPELESWEPTGNKIKPSQVFNDEHGNAIRFSDANGNEWVKRGMK